MHRLLLIFTAVGGVLSVGCARDHFVVEITPDGEHFERKLTAWHETTATPPEVSQLPTETLERFAKLYGRKGSLGDAAKQTFAAKFEGKTPNDVGGAGSYTHFTSSLGSASIYMERFRGNDDVEAALAKRRAAVDELIEILIGWINAEVDDPDTSARVRKFFDKELRQDIKNLGIYGWTHRAVLHDDAAGAAFFARVGQYLIERDYFSPAEMPALLRTATSMDGRAIAPVVQRMVARKIGIAAGEEIPESLAFLGDPQAVESSLRKHLESTGQFRKRIAAWEAAKKKGADVGDRPDALVVVYDLLGEAVFKLDLSASDQVEVKLHTGVKPVATNGSWDPVTKGITWSGSLDAQPSLPMLVFATWSEPNDGEQTEHFGRVLLAGKELSQYVVWYRGLKGSERAEWDKFLTGLKPDGELRDKLETFRFTTDPPIDPVDENKATSQADGTRKLLLDAFNAK